MARTNAPVTNFTANAGLADPAPTAIDQANGMNVAAKGLSAHIVLRIKNTAGASKNVIVRAGVAPPALSAGQVTLPVAVAAGATKWLGPFESARFAQADGSVNVDFETGTTGEITAFRSTGRF